MKKKNVPTSDIDKGINDSLSLQGIVPAKILNHDIKDRGKIECYEKGTIAQYEYENTVFYLMALSEFDENNNAQNTKEELVQKLISKKQATFLFLGSGFSRHYINTPDWRGILEMFAPKHINQYFSVLNTDSQPIIATHIAKDLTTNFWNRNGLDFVTLQSN